MEYRHKQKVHINTTGPTFSERSNKISFFVSNCKAIAAWRRDLLVKISELLPVESFGGGRFCGWPRAKQVSMSRDWPQCKRPMVKEFQERRYAEKECVLRNSRVSFVMENSKEDFYATEKLYQALYAGVVPVYKGAPNIRDILPHPDAAILVDEFANLTALVEYVDRVNHDENLFRKHTAWKNLPFSDGFLGMLRTEFSLCSVCEHYAAEATPAVHLPGVREALPQCVLDTFAAASDGKAIAVNGAETAGGVDAVFVLADSDGHAEEAPPAAARLIQAAWGASPVVIRDTFGAQSTCTTDVAMCTAFAGQRPSRSQTFPCAQHAFAAYLTVIHGLQNVLVLGSSSSTLPSHVSDKARWSTFLASLPPEYEAVDLATCAAVAVAKPGAVCSDVYLMSQKGARRVLRGDPLSVIRSPVGSG
jgi:hypothetical protein